MRGGKPKPTALKVLQGNPGHRPLNKREPKPDKTIPDCPKWLNKVAQARWHYEADILERTGVMTEADQGVLEMRSYLYGEIMQLAKDIEKEGRIFKDIKINSDGLEYEIYKPNPKAIQIMHLIREYRAHGCLLGLDPSSRAKLQTGDAGEVDPFDKFLKDKGGK